MERKKMIVSIEELRQYRIDAGYSQAELALEVGVTQSYIARMEKGNLDPKYSIVCAIVEVVKGLRNIKCIDVMDTTPATIDARQTVTIARDLMRRRHVTILPVVKSARVIGCITDIDISRNDHLDLNQLSVEAILNPLGIPIVDEQTPILTAIPLLDTYSAVVVQSTGRLTGTISREDISKLERQGYPIHRGRR
ncbi:MAG: CBS domain-containing protein [Candidatus Thorarchaeota archaeon]